jgi:hypothetical protein
MLDNIPYVKLPANRHVLAEADSASQSPQLADVQIIPFVMMRMAQVVFGSGPAELAGPRSSSPAGPYRSFTHVALPTDQLPFKITIGSVPFVSGEGKVATAINAPDTASGVIPAEAVSTSPVDWSAPARVTIGESLLTTGHVVEAAPTNEGAIRWDVQSALMLSENRMPPMVCQNLSSLEVGYAAAREAGFQRDQMHIQGLDAVASEAMWVLAPVGGIEADQPTRVGAVEFIDGPSGLQMLRRFNPAIDSSLTGSFAAAPAFARVAVVASLIYDAEQEGTAMIDTAAAWLTVRVRYAWSHLPDGRPQHYTRGDTRVEIARQDGLCVIAIDGDRRWWRGTTMGPTSQAITLSRSSPWADPPMPNAVAEPERDALLAIHRAAHERDPVQRVAAFWEAAEFYVGGRGSRKLFEAEDIATVVARATAGASDDHATRITQLLEGLLNSESLMTKLKRVLAEDGVPVTADDLAVLRRLRKQRNRAVHGAAAAPAHADLDQAIAFISRAMVIRCR